MSNKRITDLTELTTPTTDDVFPVVDIATNTTTKVQLGNLPTTTAVTTALATKQDTLVSGTNIKTVNSTSLLGSGNVAVQETLVSGTNIKTLNSTSLLGSGDIVLTANPSGVAGAIQFSNGSAFASDASNLFWDDTNNRLGVGTNAPTSNFDVKSTATSFVFAQFLANNGNEILTIRNNSDNSGNILAQNVTAFSIGTNTTTARLTVKGSGSTSATTSLLVQNSAGATAMTVKDDRTVTFADRVNTPLASILSDGTIQHWYLQTLYGGVIGAYAYPGAGVLFEIRSTTQGFLPPRMTTTQKNAIATPPAGLMVYDSTTNKLCCYNGSTWNDLF